MQGLSEEGTKPDVFPMECLALSINFEREVSTNISPILFIDFAPVFAYVSGAARRAHGYLEGAGSRSEPN